MLVPAALVCCLTCKSLQATSSCITIFKQFQIWADTQCYTLVCHDYLFWADKRKWESEQIAILLGCGAIAVPRRIWRLCWPSSAGVGTDPLMHGMCLQVPETAQTLVSNEDKLLTSPRDASPNRTLVVPNGPGIYTAYVCAVDALGGRACANGTLTVHPPCPGDIPMLDVLKAGLDFAPALSGNDTHAVLEVCVLHRHVHVCAVQQRS